ncbi:phospholipase D-like domain-containing protein [Hydrogenimonas urashimensis]|uniref:phospholipase D-like domain-containing protein n=1 Tax=Hydrogenimonas urashimensis TaxID=2740515 RepID=UPI001916281F|nr:phospholipase D-like domain-containing protein [Hydrogenimonas urashimensis]
MRIFRPLIILLALLAAASAQPAKSRLFTLPYEARDALRTLTKTIDNAHDRIDAAIYSFTHKTIAKHLKNAARRGVKIRIIFDRSANLRNRKSQLGYLAKYRNIETMLLAGKPYRDPDGDRALMHMKMMVVDSRHVVLGSANWTYSAFGKNYEVILFIDDYAAAKRLERSFERMMRSATPY